MGSIPEYAKVEIIICQRVNEGLLANMDGDGSYNVGHLPLMGLQICSRNFNKYVAMKQISLTFNLLTFNSPCLSMTHLIMVCLEVKVYEIIRYAHKFAYM